jgi:dihydroneopterin aldolase
MNSLYSHLKIRQVDLQLNLGWRSKERAQEQGILLDIDIYFPTAPTACETDHLDNTVCYDQLIQTIREKLGDKSFRLIEHLARDIYLIVKTNLPDNAATTIHITKFPKVTGLIGGVCFSYGDTK